MTLPAWLSAAVPIIVQMQQALIGVQGVGFRLCDQGGGEGSEQGFAVSARVVHELEEAEIERQFVLRNAAVRAQPGAQQRPEPLDGIDVHLAEAVASSSRAYSPCLWQTVLCR